MAPEEHLKCSPCTLFELEKSTWSALLVLSLSLRRALEVLSLYSPWAWEEHLKRSPCTLLELEKNTWSALLSRRVLEVLQISNDAMHFTGIFQCNFESINLETGLTFRLGSSLRALVGLGRMPMRTEASCTGTSTNLPTWIWSRMRWRWYFHREGNVSYVYKGAKEGGCQS